MHRKVATLVVFLVLFLGLALAGTGFAHDFWTQAGSYIVEKGTRIDLRLFNGHGDELNEYPYIPDRIVRFEAHGPNGTLELTRRKNALPAGRLTLDEAGIHTVVYQSRHSYVELDAEKFEPYLREEGLDGIIVERRRRGESKKPGQESYARYCKALIQVAGGTEGFDRKVGLPHEITALGNPFRAKPGDSLTFQVEHEGKAFPGAHVELISLDDLDEKLGSRTNKRGQVKFKLPKPGRWMVATTHMRRAPARVKGDWESYWASLTFEVPGRSK